MRARANVAFNYLIRHEAALALETSGFSQLPSAERIDAANLLRRPRPVTKEFACLWQSRALQPGQTTLVKTVANIITETALSGGNEGGIA